MLSYVLEFEVNEPQIRNDKTVIPSGDNMHENVWDSLHNRRWKM